MGGTLLQRSALDRDAARRPFRCGGRTAAPCRRDPGDVSPLETGLLVSPVTAPLDQHPALALEDVLVALVHAVVLEAHDAGILAIRIARLHDLAEAVQRVAVIERALQPDLVHAELGERVLGGV